MQWCKQRALEYVDQGDVVAALASMTSDLRKHPDTTHLVEFAGMIGPGEAMRGPESMRRFIEGFAE